MPHVGGGGAAFRCTLNCSCSYARCCSPGGQRSRVRTPRVSFQRESGEAPPVADKASRFRGSGAIGGPAKGPGIAMPRRWKGRGPSFGRFKVGSRGGKSESRPWCLFLHGHRALSPHREEMPEAPPAADEARAFRGSGAIGSPVQGPGIAMPRRCSEGGGGPSTTMVEFFHQIFKAGQGAFFAAICRIPPHRWTAVYSCGEPPHPRTPLSAAHSPQLWKSRHSLRLGPGAPCAFHQLLKAALSPGFIKPHPLGPQGGRIAISLQTVYTGRDSF